ncbi:putative toxin-antitoxin system toxin component, PIN family [Syntrophomonas palmitatica]|uniref:putative toxin-antitoxin system toxin component, PIN family n=1 Tax=Syntrophomonas palmitatica TaxID=402877 RepID=UPI0009FAB05B|nr:putative toxin-antitoxin system toxin component, PIN family [Syntrophomonas palmitatica]
MKPIRIFLDSSVIIAGLASSKGGSREILNLAELRVVVPIVSEEVVKEVIRNVEKKLPQTLPHYYQLFRSLPFVMVEPSESHFKTAAKLINLHDAKILAAAISTKIDWLISLDKHFLDMKTENLEFKIGSPGDFLCSGDLRPESK